MLNEDEKREILLKHARHPKNVGELTDAHAKGQCHNPLCGDRVQVSLLIENDIVQNVKIRPSGCSISVASASLMTEVIKGKSILELNEYVKEVNETFTNGLKTQWPENLNALSPLMRIRENPLKIPCALIGWMATKEALKNYQTKEQVCSV